MDTRPVHKMGTSKRPSRGVSVRAWLVAGVCFGAHDCAGCGSPLCLTKGVDSEYEWTSPRSSGQTDGNHSRRIGEAEGDACREDRPDRRDAPDNPTDGSSPEEIRREGLG